jgi:hypothetical protein
MRSCQAYNDARILSYSACDAESAVVAANANGPVAASFLEVKRWMTRIGFEQLIVGSSKLLNFWRERIEESPKVRAGEMLQISRLFPAR